MIVATIVIIAAIIIIAVVIIFIVIAMSITITKFGRQKCGGAMDSRMLNKEMMPAML
jgi:hypothetical protein